MRVFTSSQQLTKLKKNLTVILGNFDGVHLAHQAMFKLGHKTAKLHDSKSLVYTFVPHPSKLLSPNSAPKMIMNLEQKISAIKNAKIDYLLLETFDKAFAKLAADDWFKKIIIDRIRAKALVVGYDFTFGKARSGNVAKLSELCSEHNIHCEVLKPNYLKNTLISSSRIRQMISSGDVYAAAKLLGRNYTMDGKIIKGKGRGRKLGIPTANLASINELNPAVGVYATSMQIKAKKYPAITNVGFNPTFGNDQLSIETYLFDFKGSLYNKKVSLEFIQRIREERKFNKASELVKQIKLDFTKAKKIHGL